MLTEIKSLAGFVTYVKVISCGDIIFHREKFILFYWPPFPSLHLPSSTRYFKVLLILISYTALSTCFLKPETSAF